MIFTSIQEHLCCLVNSMANVMVDYPKLGRLDFYYLIKVSCETIHTHKCFYFFKKRQISCSKEFHCFFCRKKIHNERLPSLLDFLFLFLWQTQPFWMGESNTVGWIRWSRKLLHPSQLFLAQLIFATIFNNYFLQLIFTTNFNN